MTIRFRDDLTKREMKREANSPASQANHCPRGAIRAHAKCEAVSRLPSLQGLIAHRRPSNNARQAEERHGGRPGESRAGVRALPPRHDSCRKARRAERRSPAWLFPPRAIREITAGVGRFRAGKSREMACSSSSCCAQTRVEAARAAARRSGV